MGDISKGVDIIYTINMRHMATSIWVNIAQVMACYLTAPSHYLNQSELIISKV